MPRNTYSNLKFSFFYHEKIYLKNEDEILIFFLCLSFKVTRAISGGEDIFESLIFSDQYVGPKQPEDE